ncbi:hypothetical protein LMG28614_04344 [Paraburkholderia ultramafica]|uniref:Uncharacterized protein n=1 Tax=Paraburkholderia ultramafica TaxID=1544867 RepID=A0A6S7BD82_9BURK|nr:hypothetical protein LMG28614_04344 [Paraburkholderia ultramafica]
MKLLPSRRHGPLIRAHSHTKVIARASHSVYQSRPEEVVAVIEDAAKHAEQ